VPPARLSWFVRAALWVRTRSVRDLGRAGEIAAAAFLRSCGLHIVARNWRGRHGELDLVAVTDGNVLVFVEVKTSRAHSELAWERIDPAKEAHLVAAGEEYLAAAGLTASTAHRFDVVVVAGDPRRLWLPLGFLWVESCVG
jgi:putative endonuclease